MIEFARVYKMFKTIERMLFQAQTHVILNLRKSQLLRFGNK